MFFSKTKAIDDLKKHLKDVELMNIANFLKVKRLAENELRTLNNVFAACGSYKINQTCYDKLVSLVEIIDYDDDQEYGLYALAESGLLDEETLELFAANSSAFNNEADSSDKESDLKATVGRIVQAQKAPVETKRFAQDFDDCISALKFFIKALGLPIISNIEKIKKLRKDSFELSILASTMSTLCAIKSESCTINQNCYDKLVSLVELIDHDDDQENGLYALAESGLLDEETLELFAANPSAFNDQAAFSQAADLKTIVEGIIQQQRALKFNP